MKIKLGYEVGSGKIIEISPSHLIVTGVTQLSGKTTTLEALIKRSGLKAIVFKTKIGEKSFSEGTVTAPFFRDRSDYEFVKSLIEAYAKEKLFLEKGTLMRLCKGSSDLIAIKKKVDDELAAGKARGLHEEILTRLQHYLENLIPQIQYANFSNVLTVYDGINIMNLERFSEEAQSLIIQSVADEVLKTMKDVVIVIPEAWKFLPQKYNNPCKRVVESFIRQGAANNNFIWIDSQDMAGVDKIPLKQLSAWILGYQSERNEVKHTLDQISLPSKLKPKEDEIMTLKKGHFILSSYDGVFRVYVQPSWMDDETALKIAKGELDVSDIKKPDNLIPYSQAPKQVTAPGVPDVCFDDSKLRKELVELRFDFFNKIQEIQEMVQKAYSEIYTIKSSRQDINEEELISKVLQKLPVNNHASNPVVNIEEVIKAVLVRVPKTAGSVTYSVSPLEKIKKDFLEEAKNKILSDISDLSQDAKKCLKFIESQGKAVTNNFIVENCFLLLGTNSSHRNKIAAAIKELNERFLVQKDDKTGNKPRLKIRIKNLLGTHDATDQEIETLYQHVLMEMLK